MNPMLTNHLKDQAYAEEHIGFWADAGRIAHTPEGDLPPRSDCRVVHGGELPNRVFPFEGLYFPVLDHGAGLLLPMHTGWPEPAMASLFGRVFQGALDSEDRDLCERLDKLEWPDEVRLDREPSGSLRIKYLSLDFDRFTDWASVIWRVHQPEDGGEDFVDWLTGYWRWLADDWTDRFSLERVYDEFIMARYLDEQDELLAERVQSRVE